MDKRLPIAPRQGRLALALSLLWLVGSACPRTSQDLKRQPAPSGSDAPAAPSSVADAGSTPTAEPARCRAEATSAPSWYHRAIGYEIFVRSFADSDGDGAGDLRGLTEKLDYLNDGDPAAGDDLGVDLLWLMPIHQSASYHGYDVTDYRRVDSEYGSEEDLARLVDEAHQRGIRVIIDLVVNHTAANHPWFLDATTGAQAEHRDWYVWSDVALDWKRPWDGGRVWHKRGNAWYYGLFWDQMPDLNFANAAVRAEMIDVARHWLRAGLDGFRLDAARYLVETGPGGGQADTPQTHEFWNELRVASEEAADAPLLLGEAWADTDVMLAYFGSKDAPELHMLFDFDLSTALQDGLRLGDATRVRTALCRRLRALPEGASVGTFVANHDMVRAATELETRGADGLRLAATLLMTLPGTPWLYYGEEIGMGNGPDGGDIAKRLPMQWEAGEGTGFTTGRPWQPAASVEIADTVAGQLADEGSLLQHYRRLIRLRRDTPALLDGGAEVLRFDGEAKGVLVVRRDAGDQHAILVANLGDEPAAVRVEGASGTYTDALGEASFSAGADGVMSIDALAPLQALILIPAG